MSNPLVTHFTSPFRVLESNRELFETFSELIDLGVNDDERDPRTGRQTKESEQMSRRFRLLRDQEKATMGEFVQR
jgi:hypothetical protein